MPDKCTEDPRDCPMLPRIEALERESDHNKDAHKEFYGKLEGSHTAVALIEQRLKQIEDNTDEIKENLQSIREKPAKRWDSIVDKVLMTIAAAVLALLLARLGL